jgi:hypothetical protein
MGGKELLARFKSRLTAEASPPPAPAAPAPAPLEKGSGPFDVYAWDGRYIQGKLVASGVEIEAGLCAIAAFVRPVSGPPFRVVEEEGDYLVYEPTAAPIGVLLRMKP